MIYTINNCIRAFGYTNFDNLIADMGSVDNLREYVRANGYADIAVAEDTELLLVDVNGKTWHTGCYGAVIEQPKPYLCFTSTGDSNVTMRQIGTPTDISNNKVIQYKLNDGEWQTWDLLSVSLADGDKMYLKSDDTIPLSEGMMTYKQFEIMGNIVASGNIMSLLNFSDTVTNYGFYCLFASCSLTQAPEIPATTLGESCYESMFSMCMSLTQAPTILPATTLATSCYKDMFSYCMSLTTTPELPATTLADFCYNNMFSSCSITQAPVLPATTLVANCYDNMFNGCSSLTTAPELPATTLAANCYNNMFNGCSSLTTAPELPATTLAENCYNSMFSSCSITQAPVLQATTLAANCYDNMFNGCSSLTTAPELPATELATDCYNGMFKNCTSLTTTPELHATTLAAFCYTAMFNGCAALTQAPVLPATTLAEHCYKEMFQNCTSLTTAPELHATTLVDSCYRSMFSGCTALTQAPELPATTLANNCYAFMFMNCSSLTKAPALPATELVDYCYNAMFQNCTSLVTTPTLSATTSAASCCRRMFYGCAALTHAPALPATTLFDYCYQEMFYKCSSLVTAPELPATTLAASCYTSMFRECTSLTTAPELPATTIYNRSYFAMFRGCSKLNYVKALFTDIPSNSLSLWLDGVSETGTFIKSKDATWSNTDAGIPTGWTVQVEGGVPPEPDPEPGKDYLCFTSTGDSTVAMTQNGTPDTSAGKVIQYKLNNGQWQTWDLSAVTLHDGDKMYLKSDDIIPISESNDIYKKFVMTGSIAASGNIMSLLNFSDTLTDYAFCKLFLTCKSLTTAPKLQATTLALYCYSQMFSYCPSLTTAPELPATTLTKSCYVAMFFACRSLTTAPELPATTLAENCYYNMFDSCTSLTTAPALPATTLANNCYYAMFYNCTSLTTAPALPATKLESACYYEMFYDCTSLTTAPDLNAPELSRSCYSRMFKGCTNLNYVKALFNTIPSSRYTSDWLSNVSSTGTFVKNSKANWQLTGASGIPTGWTVQTVEGEDPKPDPHTDYLCLTAVNDGTTVQLYGKKVTEGNSTTMLYQPLNYKINDGGWSSMDMTHTDMTSDNVTLNAGDKMYLKGYIGSQDTNLYMNIFINGLVDCSGNINSINNFSKNAPDYCFYKLFEGADIRTAAITFDFDTVGNNAFDSMFNNCTSLTTAPATLPATLGQYCYTDMFKGCSSLTTAPALPATTLAIYCYYNMFYGCTSLVQAPELPATTLVLGCYQQMFYGCTKLNYVKAMFTNAENTTIYFWLNGVSETGTFVKNTAATWTNEQAGIPTGWTVQTASPDK